MSAATSDGEAGRSRAAEGVAPSRRTFPADVSNVGAARRMLREALLEAGAEEHADAATLALSELVTNVFVHAGSAASLTVWAAADGVRVEVEDASSHLPVRRRYAHTARTGRGLQLVEELTDRWGAHTGNAGKTVWFEVGEPIAGIDRAPDEELRPARDEASARPVTLRQAPLLMHWAWQEHAAALLREYMLSALEEDFTVLDRHAEASSAMSLLEEQLPAPAVSEHVDALMADALEPAVTAEEVVLQVQPRDVSNFAVLDDLLRRATVEARAGRLLAPPTQPEIEEMRAWICDEVARQARDGGPATPWVARTDVRATLADVTVLENAYGFLASVDEPLLATDEASVIVAASAAALELLGYDRATDLVGRRVIVVVPERFHQAHIAGTTLNATNGRDLLLGVPLTVPMVRADGTEVLVNIEVRPERLDEERRVFLARFNVA